MHNNVSMAGLHVVLRCGLEINRFAKGILFQGVVGGVVVLQVVLEERKWILIAILAVRVIVSVGSMQWGTASRAVAEGSVGLAMLSIAPWAGQPHGTSPVMIFVSEMILAIRFAHPCNLPTPKDKQGVVAETPTTVQTPVTPPTTAVRQGQKIVDPKPRRSRRPPRFLNLLR
jgi:hypothetical protein